MIAVNTQFNTVKLNENVFFSLDKILNIKMKKLNIKSFFTTTVIVFGNSINTNIPQCHTSSIFVTAVIVQQFTKSKWKCFEN